MKNTDNNEKLRRTVNNTKEELQETERVVEEMAILQLYVRSPV